MKLKKLFSLLLAVALCAALFACGKGETGVDASTSTGTDSAGTDVPAVRTEMRVLALSGSTGLGMAKLMADNEAGTTANAYTFEVFDAPETLLPEVTSGKCAIAALPTNVAAKLWQKTEGAIQILAVNTLGVLYTLEIGTKTISSVADLKGKTIYTTGQGSTPEYALNYILTKNGLDPQKDVTVVYETTADGVVSHAESGAVLMLPEPKVTAVKGSVENVNVVLDMTAEWNKVCDTPMVQGCVVVNTAFAKEHPEAVAAFLGEYGASISYVKDNPTEASELVAKYGIIPKAALAAKAIPNSNMTFLTGTEMKNTLVPFYQILFDADKTSVGGKLPDDGFYYGA